MNYKEYVDLYPNEYKWVRDLEAGYLSHSDILEKLHELKNHLNDLNEEINDLERLRYE